MSSDPQDAHAAPSSDAGSETLSPLEQEVLDEYARLLENLNNVRSSLHLSSPSPFHSLPFPSSYLPSPNPLTQMRLRMFTNEYAYADIDGELDVHTPPRLVEPAQRRDTRWLKGSGEEDESGFYVVEGECV